MPIKSQDLPGLQRAIDRALAKERGEDPDLVGSLPTYVLRTPLLKAPVIQTKDVIAFMREHDKLKKAYPNLPLYIFEVTYP